MIVMQVSPNYCFQFGLIPLSSEDITNLMTTWKSQVPLQGMINITCQSLPLNKHTFICINHIWQELFKPASNNLGEQLGIIAQ